MSATGRTGALPRHEDDFYETPAWVVDLLLDELGLTESFEGYVIDPGSGSGAIAERVAKRCPRADVRGIEQNPELVAKAKAIRLPSVAFECADFLEWKPDGQADLVLGNPPYQKWIFDPKKIVKKRGKPTGEIGGLVCVDPDLAAKFVTRALEISSRKATVAMLLRGTFLVPKVRRALRELPCDLLFLEKRPSFNGSGTDATDYAWCVWGPRRGGKWTVLRKPEGT
jgi:trans-aconitate methyltransferase